MGCWSLRKTSWSSGENLWTLGSFKEIAGRIKGLGIQRVLKGGQGADL